ncbi:MAG: SMC-Scp complex subunit ScpB [Mycobacteriales bacterium]
MTADERPAGEEATTATATDGDAPNLGLPALLEALLVTVDGPLVPEAVCEALGVEAVEVVAALDTLSAEYRHAGRGFALRSTAAGWLLYAVPAARPALERVVVGERSARLSNAALETLAVVAYQQPVSRSRVAAVRGVNVDAVFRTLTARGLISDVGTDDTSGAILYGTTPLFLHKIGVSQLSELPELAPLLPDLATTHALHDELST